MDKIKFAMLIGFITMIVNRGAGTLSVNEIEEIDRMINDVPAPKANIENLSNLLKLIRHTPERKIDAIKQVRTLTGLALKEAKDLVEAI